MSAAQCSARVSMESNRGIVAPDPSRSMARQKVGPVPDCLRDGHHDPAAIPGAVPVAQRIRPLRSGRFRRIPAGRQCRLRIHGLRVDGGIEQRHIDFLPDARPLADQQRQCNGSGEALRHVVVAETGPAPRWFIRRLAQHSRRATSRPVGRAIVPRGVPLGPALAQAIEVGADQLRIQLGETVIGEVILVQFVRPEV